jgi:hypothetical protein
LLQDEPDLDPHLAYLAELPAEEKCAILQLAMNSMSRGTALAAARLLPGDLGPEALCKLLLTAAARLQFPAVQHMLDLPAVLGHVDAATLEALLLHAVTHDNTGVFSMVWYAADPGLLSTAAVVRLLTVAARKGAGMYISCLAVGQARQMSSSDLVQLMLAAVNSGSGLGVGALCSLPTAKALSSEIAAQFIEAAVVSDVDLDGRGLLDLFELPGCQQLGSEEVARLLQLALEQASFEAAYEISRLSAAQQLSADQVAQLLKALLQHPSEDKDAQLLQTLLQQTKWGAMLSDSYGTRSGMILCNLPAAQEISSAVLAQLLQAAVEQGHARHLQELCSLPAAQQIDGEVRLQLQQV